VNLSIKKTVWGILALSLVWTQHVSAVERSFFYPPAPEDKKNTQKKEEEVKKGVSEIGNGLSSQEGRGNELQNCNEVLVRGKNYNKNQRRKQRISEKKEAAIDEQKKEAMIEEQKNKDVVFLKSEEDNNKGLKHEQSLLLAQPVSAINPAKTEEVQIEDMSDEELRIFVTSEKYILRAFVEIENILGRMNKQSTENHGKTIFNFHAETDSELTELATNINKLEYFEGGDQCGPCLIYREAMGKHGRGFAQPFTGPARKMIEILLYLGKEGNLNQENFDKNFLRFFNFNLFDCTKNESSIPGYKGLKILLEKYVRIKLPVKKSMQNPHNKPLEEDQEEGK
jgi:hypothetical protein